VLANKAATDKAAKLDSEAAEIRRKLAKTPAVKEANPLGEALGRLLPWLSAASAATFQQAVVSAIAELLIAAALALPELLRREALAGARREPDEVELRPVLQVVASNSTKPGSVPEIMARALEPADGQRIELADAFNAYAAICRARELGVLPPAQFVAPLQRFCQEVGIQTEAKRARVYLLGVRLSA
jgi:hypothetical protein